MAQGDTFDRFADAEPMAVGDDDVLQRESSSYASVRPQAHGAGDARMAPGTISVAVWHPLDRVDLRVQLASHLRGRMASAVVRYGTAKTTQKELRAIKVRYGMITIMQNTFRTTTVWYGTYQRPFLRFCTVPQTGGERRNRGIPTFSQSTPVCGTVRNAQTPQTATPYHNSVVQNE